MPRDVVDGAIPWIGYLLWALLIGACLLGRTRFKRLAWYGAIGAVVLIIVSGPLTNLADALWAERREAVGQVTEKVIEMDRDDADSHYIVTIRATEDPPRTYRAYEVPRTVYAGVEVGDTVRVTCRMWCASSTGAGRSLPDAVEIVEGPRRGWAWEEGAEGAVRSLLLASAIPAAAAALWWYGNRTPRPPAGSRSPVPTRADRHYADAASPRASGGKRA